MFNLMKGARTSSVYMMDAYFGEAASFAWLTSYMNRQNEDLGPWVRVVARNRYLEKKAKNCQSVL